MQAQTHHFLAITDSKPLLLLLQECVKNSGYSLDIVKTGAEGFKGILASKPDLIFIDAATPDMDCSSWLSILKEMREGRGLPVIVTGEKLGYEEISLYFELGADDCIVTRQCDPREFAARIRATLRRHAAPADKVVSSLSIGPVELDSARHRCFVNGAEVLLRAREFELLEMLMQKSGRVLNRPYLLECVWGMASSANTRAVDVTISRLRKALGPAAGWIGSVDRFGYRFAPPPGTKP